MHGAELLWRYKPLKHWLEQSCWSNTKISQWELFYKILLAYTHYRSLAILCYTNLKVHCDFWWCSGQLANDTNDVADKRESPTTAKVVQDYRQHLPRWSPLSVTLSILYLKHGNKTLSVITCIVIEGVITQFHNACKYHDNISYICVTVHVYSFKGFNTKQTRRVRWELGAAGFVAREKKLIECACSLQHLVKGEPFHRLD